MRVETTTRDLYRLDELDDETQAKAIDNYRELRAQWWDEFDSDRIAETIVYTLAEKLAAPGWDTFGEGDFPGIDGLEVTEWDVDRHTIDIDATLTRDNAPALPWPDDCGYYRHGRPNVNWTGDRRDLWIADVYPEWMADRSREDVQAFFDAVDEALRDAIRAGAAEYEYMFSEDALREDIKANEREFLADGTVA